MNSFTALMIWFLPGCVFALHQGIDHVRGSHIPKIVVFDWDVPHWIIYALVFLLGPIILLALLAQSLSRS